MFQRALILVAISAAFPSVISQYTLCGQISNELHRELGTEDPHTFPIISDFIYIRDSYSLNLNFYNLIFTGFSGAMCTLPEVSGQGRLATLIFKGSNLEFKSSDTEIDINLPDFAGQLKTSFTSQVHSYTLELRFIKDANSLDPFKPCIKKGSLEMIFDAEGIVIKQVNPKVILELDIHPEAVLKAINLYLPRFANDITTRLNNIICQTNPNPRPPNPRGRFCLEGTDGSPTQVWDCVPSTIAPGDACLPINK
ncbi:uncharacterized protein [Palaemon carinicauda]|uniref:uncharacterized protein n=1 Tax=Palaemon carinicauda TaxID=392227 RepID=UPI0035B65D0C